MENEAKIKKIIHLMQTDASADAPEDLQKWAKNLYRSRLPQTRGSALRKIVATLQQEILGGRPAFGERSAEGSAERQMLFRAGDAAIDLRVSGSKKAYTLRGQVIAPAAEGAVVELIGQTERSAEADNLGMFEFKKVEPGEYSVKVTVAGTETVIESIIIS